jgi:hypothetical protein
MDEIGYIYAFTDDEVQTLEPYKFVSQLRGIKVEGDREYQDWIELLKNSTDASVGFKTVVLSVFRVSHESKYDFDSLHALHPGYELFLVVNPTVHALMQKASAYRYVGLIPIGRIKELQQELFLYFLATPLESNRHLWPDNHWPRRSVAPPKERFSRVEKTNERHRRSSFTGKPQWAATSSEFANLLRFTAR